MNNDVVVAFLFRCIGSAATRWPNYRLFYQLEKHFYNTNSVFDVRRELCFHYGHWREHWRTPSFASIFFRIHPARFLFVAYVMRTWTTIIVKRNSSIRVRSRAVHVTGEFPTAEPATLFVHYSIRSSLYSFILTPTVKSKPKTIPNLQPNPNPDQGWTANTKTSILCECAHS